MQGGDCELLCYPFCLPFGSPQSVNSLLKTRKLVTKNPQILDQFVIEFQEFSKCLGFITVEV
jgi:hypothetical protein